MAVNTNAGINGSLPPLGGFDPPFGGNIRIENGTCLGLIAAVFCMFKAVVPFVHVQYPIMDCRNVMVHR